MLGHTHRFRFRRSFSEDSDWTLWSVILEHPDKCSVSSLASDPRLSTPWFVTWSHSCKSSEVRFTSFLRARTPESESLLHPNKSSVLRCTRASVSDRTPSSETLSQKPMASVCSFVSDIKDRIPWSVTPEHLKRFSDSREPNSDKDLKLVSVMLVMLRFNSVRFVKEEKSCTPTSEMSYIQNFEAREQCDENHALVGETRTIH
mmetsp:Transcript_41999/g.82480  ORF Transcript_41999/g.82480 Transcript_41999/m.82480 type:complete len:203 (-) Transcript_41999:154-762(-)